MIITLVGYRGSGKSTIGRKLADRLWQDFVDIDDRIVASAGKNIRQIFAEDGEDRFRQIETECLREALKKADYVLGLGGGTLMRPENREMIRAADCRVIYLKCDEKELLRRIESDPQSAQTRPNLTNLGGGIEEIRLKLAEREPVYREMKTAELDVTHLTPEEAVVYIARMV